MMKKKMPSEGLRLGRDSGSILCDTLKKVAFSDSLGGGKAKPYLALSLGQDLESCVQTCYEALW